MSNFFMLISEDKIKKAVDESIERFMLEEANFFTNALYNWMDKRTGGQWNAEYGLYPDYGNINARSSVSWMQMYRIYGIFTKWLDYHRTQLYKRAQSDTRRLFLFYKGLFQYLKKIDYMVTHSSLKNI